MSGLRGGPRYQQTKLSWHNQQPGIMRDGRPTWRMHRGWQVARSCWGQGGRAPRVIQLHWSLGFHRPWSCNRWRHPGRKEAWPIVVVVGLFDRRGWYPGSQLHRRLGPLVSMAPIVRMHPELQASWAARAPGDQARWDAGIPSIQGAHPGEPRPGRPTPRLFGRLETDAAIGPCHLGTAAALISSCYCHQGAEGSMGPGCCRSVDDQLPSPQRHLGTSKTRAAMGSGVPVDHGNLASLEVAATWYRGLAGCEVPRAP